MRTRTLLSFAVVALLAVLPGPLEAHVRPHAEMPEVSVPVRLPQPQAAAAPADDPPARAATTPETRPTHTDATAPDLVRVVDVLYAHTHTSDDEPTGFDLGGPCPGATTCEVFELALHRRVAEPDGRVVIPFAYNDDGRRAARVPDEGTVRAAFARSAAEWMRWNPKIAFVDEGTTDAAFAADGDDGGCSDGVNVVTWDKFPPNVVGVASTCLDRTNSVVIDTDLALNSHHRWADGTDERRPSYDLQSIFTHELGHWLSLKDLYVAIDASRQTMFGSTDPNETHKRTLALGDVVGVQTAYPCADACPLTDVVDD